MSTKLEVLALISRKDEMVKELDTLLASLDEQNVGMNRTLTTFDGYPRDDVDIPVIRQQRNRVYCLQNDIKEIMEQIRRGLPLVFNSDQPVKQLAPFAYVAQVDIPTGLQVNDKIVRFGNVDADNNNGLRALAGQLTKKPLRVKVLRDGEEKDLELMIEGKLGARIMPL